MNTELLKHLPLGTSSFEALRDSKEIYVDKTDYIYQLASNRGKYFLARPRRFGKSLLISTFESLFKHGTKFFKGLEIEKLWKENKTYEVVRLDFSEVKDFDNAEDFAKRLTSLLARKFAFVGFVYKQNDIFPVTDQLSDWLQTKKLSSLVILIDEYDAPLTSCLDRHELFRDIRSQLSRFYAVLKSNDSALRFLFITGITKFNKTNLFSELNNLSDISLSPKYGSLLGYTHDEVKKYFSHYLECTADSLSMRQEELLKELTEHYDGFCFESTAKQKVFAPWSLLKFLSDPQAGFKDYWFESGGKPSVLVKYLRSHTIRTPEVYGNEKTLPLNVLEGSSDVESLSDVGLLTQTGYLTIKKIQGTTAYVDYPNLEVRTAMAQVYLEQMLDGKTVEQVGAGNIAYLLAHENAETIYQNFNQLLKKIDYQAYKKITEATIQSFIQIYCCGGRLNARSEVHNHFGRSDLEVTAGFRHWVFEFKLVRAGESADKKLEEAVEQIIDREYGSPEEKFELKRMALVFSQEQRSFVKWAEVNFF